MKTMRLIREVRLGIENLLLHKLRSLLTLLGVVFGVGSVVAMLSVGEGASKEALDQIKRLGSTNLLISSVKPAKQQLQSQMSSFVSTYGLTYADHARIAEGLATVERTAPVKSMRQDASLHGRTIELRVVGTTPDWFDLVPREVLAGRELLDSDADRMGAVAVLTEFGARKLLATERTIGQTIRIGANAFEVVGIVRSMGGQAGQIQLPDDEIDVYIPLGIARSYYGDVNMRIATGSVDAEQVQLHQIIAQVDAIENVEAVAEAIDHMLARFHQKKDYITHVPLALLREAEAIKRRYNIVLGSIAGISLVVGGIGIMNIMLASVTERTREIGIRRAIGAKRRQIVAQFLIETVVLSTTGGLIGLAVGVLVPRLITSISGMATILTPLGIVLPLLISASIGVVFGLYPAVRAAQVEPIVALRHE